MAQRKTKGRATHRRITGLRVFRAVAIALGLGVGALLVYLPGRSVDAEEQVRQLTSAMGAYDAAQAENNRLRRALAESSTEEFVKHVARRDYGYCVYGEIIYEVENIDQLLPEQPFEVYSGAEAEDEGGV